MLLAIDAGNSNVVFALAEGDRIVERWRIATDPLRTSDEYAAWLNALLAASGRALRDIDAVIIVSVVAPALRALEALARDHLKTEPLVAGRPPAGWDIALDVADPASVGADRVVNAIAARAAHPGDLIVVDMGTATTFDVIARGAYRGGIIAPGMGLSLDALTSAAPALPRIAIVAPAEDGVIGRTTEAQMLTGVYWGYVSLIEGLVERLRTQIGRPAKVIATGGLSALIAGRTSAVDAVDPDLTIRGLVMIHARAAS